MKKIMIMAFMAQVVFGADDPSNQDIKVESSLSRFVMHPSFFSNLKRISVKKMTQKPEGSLIDIGMDYWS